jgi:gamma-glutamylcyclotransferase
MMIHYFAYGSNLHPARLTERVEFASLVASAQVFGYQLKFHKLGQDDSAKCNLWHTGRSPDSVYGAIYTLASRHKPLLDEFEGKGSGYDDCEILVPHDGKTLRCFTYLAQKAYIMDSLKPYDWYKQLVVRGAHYLDFPDYYLQKLDAVVSHRDPDSLREQTHRFLLQTIAGYPVRIKSEKTCL